MGATVTAPLLLREMLGPEGGLPEPEEPEEPEELDEEEEPERTRAERELATLPARVERSSELVLVCSAETLLLLLLPLPPPAAKVSSPPKELMVSREPRGLMKMLSSPSWALATSSTVLATLSVSRASAELRVGCSCTEPCPAPTLPSPSAT
jgi:hypothetical protein